MEVVKKAQREAEARASGCQVGNSSRLERESLFNTQNDVTTQLTPMGLKTKSNKLFESFL